MADTPENMTAIDVLRDGQWHWAPGSYQRALIPDTDSALWIHGTASEPGHYPRRDAYGYRAEYCPEADITDLGLDVYATNGRLWVGRMSVLAVILPWPAPEFMRIESNMDAAWFIKAWSDEELRAGHFHVPGAAPIREGDIRQIAANNGLLRQGIDRILFDTN